MPAARLAVISGATGGIGRVLADGFVATGYEVIGVDRVAAEDTEGLRHVALDLSDAAAVKAFGTTLDRIDVLVNAAGIIRRVDEYDPDVFEEVVDINLTGSMRLAAACRAALAGRGGAIINIASMYAYFGAGHAPGYAASKGGIVQLTKSLAVAWAKEGIRVNALAPGWIATPLAEAARRDPERNRLILERTPMGRWGEPKDLVGPALFLASDAASFVTGVVLPVDGGYSSM